MADIFSRDDARNLLRGKFVFMLGDSNTRASYKDLVFLLSKNEITSLKELRIRGEENFSGDKRICFKELTAGRHYIEGREFFLYGCHVEYHFITKCYTDQIEQFFFKIRDKVMRTPDVVIINSCIWDISRWGPNGVELYKENMAKLIRLLDNCLPKETLFIWTSALPVSTILRGGLIVKQIDFLQNVLRFDVMEANLFCRDLIVSHNYDFLDTHYYLRMQIHKRLKDGLHFEPQAMRLITNLLLTHIALAWDVPLPGNTKSIALDRIVQRSNYCETTKTSSINFPIVPKCLTTKQRTNAIAARKWTKPPRRRPFRRGPMQQNFTDRPKPLMFVPSETPPWQPQNDDAPDWKNPAAQQRQQQYGMDGVSRNYTRTCSWNDDDINNNGNTKDNRYTKSRYPNFDDLPSGPFRRNTKCGTRTRPY